MEYQPSRNWVDQMRAQLRRALGERADAYKPHIYTRAARALYFSIGPGEDYQARLREINVFKLRNVGRDTGLLLLEAFDPEGFGRARGLAVGTMFRYKPEVEDG